MQKAVHSAHNASNPKRTDFFGEVCILSRHMPNSPRFASIAGTIYLKSIVHPNGAER